MRYSLCCEPLITGQVDASTALALMRSRYTAYVLGVKGYIIRTWAPEFRPEDVDLSDPVPHWLGLQIHGSKDGNIDDDQGYVDFSATYLLDGSCWILRENSRFIRLERRWYYQNGEGRTMRTKIHRNEPCPCGSERKYKRCCGS
jgi:SEC-C motif-containing protein